MLSKPVYAIIFLYVLTRTYLKQQPLLKQYATIRSNSICAGYQNFMTWFTSININVTVNIEPSII